MSPELQLAAASATPERPVPGEEEEAGVVLAVTESEAAPGTVEVLEGGGQTTVQDFPGRLGYRAVGVPPSGPMDALSFRLANRLLENAASAPALEITSSGPTLKFHAASTICLTGAPMAATLDGESVSFWRRVEVEAGQTLVLGELKGHGCRAYLAASGGFEAPRYLGSASTALRHELDGHTGRILRAGDLLQLAGPARLEGEEPVCHALPEFGESWKIGVLYGPHAAPDFFTPEDMRILFSNEWTVRDDSARTGVALASPGELPGPGLGGIALEDPFALHDHTLAVGAIGFLGDGPTIFGPDGPGPGEFQCPACVVHAELWKVGQLRAGDRVRFHRLSEVEALALDAAQEQAIAQLAPLPEPTSMQTAPASEAVQARLTAFPEAPELVCRAAGDRHLLIEYGPCAVDLEMHFRVHALMRWLERRELPGLIDLTPGLRSLEVHYDPHRITRADLLALVGEAELELTDEEELEVPSRTVHLPLSWDDPALRMEPENDAAEDFREPSACCDDLELIRRLNGLDSIEQVREIVFGATYLVIGMGTSGPGGPMMVPLDPRHRLIAPRAPQRRARTPENAVGLNHAYLCVSGAEGPGDDRLVGRTVPMWYPRGAPPKAGDDLPWLLRFCDRVHFYPMAAEELQHTREELAQGRFHPRIEPGVLLAREYRAFLSGISAEAAAFQARQRAAWEAARLG